MTEASPTTRRKAPATIAEINAIKKVGRHSIGDGLLLVVNASGSRSWLARVRDPSGRRRDIGLGSYPDVSLKEARERVAEFRRQTRDGVDPVAAKRKARDVVPTFKDAAERVFKEREAGFKNPKHKAQWIGTLREYAFPALGSLSIDQVNGPDIVRAMKKIWVAKPETARRVLQRIGTVIAWATAHGYRDHEAPMQAIRMGLPPQTRPVNHHTAIPYAAAPAAVKALRAKDPSMSRLCLEFLILTAARSGEARGARWEEFDFDAGLWTVPASRMKMKVDHVVPLPADALALIKGLAETRSSPLVFPGVPGGRRKGAGEPVLSDTALSREMGLIAPGTTVHGWRSAFRDWVAEETNVSSEVAEKALAHQIANAVERAYRRGALLEKRRALMEAWAGYIAGRSADVVQLKGAAA